MKRNVLLFLLLSFSTICLFGQIDTDNEKRTPTNHNNKYEKWCIKGDNYYNSQIFEKAFFWYSKAAEKGSAYAQSKVGTMYFDGTGCDQSFERAIFWYKKASNQGNAEGQLQLGIIYCNGSSSLGKDTIQAVTWIMKAIEQRSNDALLAMGLMYLNDYCIKPDFTKAVYWYKRLAEKGVTDGWGLSNISYGYEVATRHFKFQEYEKAINILECSKEDLTNLNIRIHDTSLLIDIYQLLADSYFEIEDDVNSMTYYQITIDLLKKYKKYDINTTSEIYYKMGGIYKKWDVFDLAIDCYDKAFNNGNNTLDRVSAVYLLKDMGDMFVGLNDFRNAQNYYNDFITIVSPERISHEDIYVFYLYEMGNKFEKKQQFVTALYYYNQIYNEINSNLKLKNDAKYLNSIFNCNIALGNYEKGNSIVYTSQDAFEYHLYPLCHDSFPTEMLLGKLYSINGKHPKALEYHLKCLNDIHIYAKLNSYQRELLITELGDDYFHLENYPKSIAFNIKNLYITLNNPSPNLNFIKSKLLRIGECLDRLGYTDQFYDYVIIAKGCDVGVNPVTLEYLKSIEQDMFFAFNGSAHIASNNGNYFKAITLHEEVVKLVEDLPESKGHQEILANAYNYVGAMYGRLKFYYKAITALKKAELIMISDFEENHQLLGVIYQNLGLAYNQIENIDLSFEYCLKSIANIRFNYGDSCINMVGAHNAMSSIYINNHKLDKAESHLKKSLNILSNIDGDNTEEIATTNNNLGMLFLDKKDYKNAVIYLRESENNYCSEKDIVQYNKLTLYQNLSNAYLGLNNFDSAFYFCRKYCKVMQNSISTNLINLPNDMKSKFFYERMWMIDMYFSLLTESSFVDKSEFFIEGYNFILALENLIFQSEKEFGSTLNATYIPSDLRNAYEESKKQIYNLRFKISRSLNDPDYNLEEFAANFRRIDSLERVLSNQESVLLDYTSPFSEFQSSFSISWESNKHQLESGETVIDFQYFSSLIDDSSNYYCAFIYKKESSHPIFVRLFDESTFLQFADATTDKNLFTKIKNMYSFSKKGKSLYELCWQPLEEYLNETTTVYVSSAGVLHNIALPLLSLGKDSLLSDKYEFHYINSATQQFDTKNASTEITTTDSIALFYNISYNKTVDSNTVHSQFSRFLGGIACPVSSWKPLESYNFTSLIQNSWKESPFVITNTGENANKGSFSSFDRVSPQVIHFFTHAFYCSFNLEKLSFRGGFSGFKHSPDPMYRSGLILAGGNIGWKENTDQGVLTSYEIQQLDLRNTKLVILSACVTGLGDLNQYEGVYGLQRAFKIAGVENIIMTLWPIYDKPTIQFFEKFYKYLAQGQSIHEAFYNSQHYMRTNDPEHPAIWGGFVLIE